MTGDPSARVSPRKTFTRSIAREAPARPSFRWTTIGTKNCRRVSGRPKPCRAHSAITSRGWKERNARVFPSAFCFQAKRAP